MAPCVDCVFVKTLSGISSTCPALRGIRVGREMDIHVTNKSLFFFFRCSYAFRGNVTLFLSVRPELTGTSDYDWP